MNAEQKAAWFKAVRERAAFFRAVAARTTTAVVLLVPVIAQAHPGHGEIHQHGVELLAAVWLTLAAAAIARRLMIAWGK